MTHIDPDAFIRHGLTLFPDGSMILIVTPGAEDVAPSAFVRGSAKGGAEQALRVAAAAQIAVERQAEAVIAAVGKDLDRLPHDIRAVYDQIVEQINGADGRAVVSRASTPEPRLRLSGDTE